MTYLIWYLPQYKIPTFVYLLYLCTNKPISASISKKSSLRHSKPPKNPPRLSTRLKQFLPTCIPPSPTPTSQHHNPYQKSINFQKLLWLELLLTPGSDRSSSPLSLKLTVALIFPYWVALPALKEKNLLFMLYLKSPKDYTPATEPNVNLQ